MSHFLSLLWKQLYISSNHKEFKCIVDLAFLLLMTTVEVRMRLKSVSIVNLVYICLLGSACAPGAFRASGVQGYNLNGSYSKACQLIDKEIVESIVLNILGQSDGKVPMVDSQGRVLSSINCKTYSGGGANARPCYYLEVYKADLTDPLCDSASFKVLNETFINACSEGIKNIQVQKNLFPQGSSDFENLFLNFVGRKPDQEELNILNSISAKDEKTKMVMSCAVVATSLAAVTVN